MSKRSVLAAMGYVGGTNRLNSYYRGDRLPSTRTLLAICGAIHASYVEVVDRFGYYHEIIKILDDLVWLGARWLEEDEARGESLGSPGAEISRVDSLRGTGILYWKDEPITWGQPIPWSDKPGLDPRNVPEFMNRYFIGSYLQLEHRAVRMKFAPIEFVPGCTFSTSAPLTLDRVDPSLERETVVVPEHTWVTVVPKAIGLAILLGVLAFPRRGDVYKEGVRQYRESLGREAHNLVSVAKTRRAEVKAPGRPRKLHTYLQRACDILDDLVSRSTTRARWPVSTSWHGRIRYAAPSRITPGSLHLSFGARPVRNYPVSRLSLKCRNSESGVTRNRNANNLQLIQRCPGPRERAGGVAPGGFAPDARPELYSSLSAAASASGRARGRRLRHEFARPLRWLHIEDGIGPHRRSLVVDRAGSGLERLVLLGKTGSLTLEALAWLRAIAAALVHLGPDGALLAHSVPFGYDGHPIRRAQALAVTTGLDVSLAFYLIAEKLDGQRANLARLRVNDLVRSMDCAKP